jgi:hypothetical protein
VLFTFTSHLTGTVTIANSNLCSHNIFFSRRY